MIAISLDLPGLRFTKSYAARDRNAGPVENMTVAKSEEYLLLSEASFNLSVYM